MSEKVTPESLKKYVTEFCAITLSKAYNGKETLSGHELLRLTPVRKINQHIVARLSSHWNNQIQNFNSPYFDFDSGEVKAALEHFSNVVSQHISLRREHLQPWLTDIVDKTLSPLTSATTLSETDEELVRQFSSVHPLVLNLPERETTAAPPASPKSVSFFALAEETPEEKTAPPVPEPKAPVQEEVLPKAEAPAKAAPAGSSTAPESLNSRFKTEAPGFSHDVNYGSVRLKLENIGQSISLAQRFMFVGQLFQGDFEAFSHSIKTLDNSGDWDTAHSYIIKNLAEKYNWDLKNEAVNELITLAKRRFN